MKDAPEPRLNIRRGRSSSLIGELAQGKHEQARARTRQAKWPSNVFQAPLALEPIARRVAGAERVEPSADRGAIKAGVISGGITRG